MIKEAIRTGIKILLLTILAAIITLVVSSITASSAVEAVTPAEASASLVGILIVSLVDVLILLWIIKLSRWTGWSLIAGLALAYFGVKTFLGQIEALAFLTPLAKELGSEMLPMTTMPNEIIIGQFLIGAALAMIVVPLAVRMMGKNRISAGTRKFLFGPAMDLTQWVWKLLAIIVVYELLYFGFGYYVAWKSPAVVAYYQGVDPGSFLAVMQTIFRDTPLLILFQAFRALLWAVFALPVVMMIRDRPWLGAFTTAIFLAVPMNIQHIIPNPFMPADVRLVHFIETTSSNFILGAFLFWLLHRSHRSLAGLFASTPQARQGQARSEA